MQRIKSIRVESATGKAKELLEGAKRKFSSEVNMFSVMATAPAALEGYFAFSGALSQGTLSPKLREQIALATAGSNGCSYCASAHTAIGETLGLTKDEALENLMGRSSDSKVGAALTFAKQVLESKGRVSEGELLAVRNAGYLDSEIVEIVAHVALNVFTNYFNETFQTEIDFPKVETPKRSCCGM